MSTQRSPSDVLAIVRLSLMISVTVAAVGAVMLRQMEAADPLMSYAAAGFAVVAIGLVLFFREQSAKQQGEQARSMAIIAWAMGEGAALFGWVVHYLGGPLVWAIPGTLVFLVAVLAVPVPRD